MLYRCAWCGQDLKKFSLTEVLGVEISHGICTECYKILLTQMKGLKKHDNIRVMAARIKTAAI